ncbi:MAG: hypothetical protein LUE64_02015, partial [Candidatus Gastranaerophilales bacterium]|nr:hypothetical protein [Candidatus Gastranaerophilales bacterium]
SRFFEMGIENNFEEDEEENEIHTLKMKEKFDFEGEDIIKLEDTSLKLKIEKNGYTEPYRKTLEIPNSQVNLIKTEKFTFFADAKKELSDYMTNNVKSTMNMSYDINEHIMLRAGHEVWYVNPNAAVGAKKFYFNPRIYLTKRCYLDYTGKYNQTTKNTEHEAGFNYKPGIFKENAGFGIKASATVNDNNEIQSRKLKFTTDFYIF